MEIKKYLEEKANYIYGARLLKFVVLLLVLLLVINSVATYMAIKGQKVILIPPVLSTQAFVSGSDASDEYLAAIARYVAALALNYTPSNARAQFNDFLALFEPSRFVVYKDIFYSLAEKVETANVTSAYFVSSIEVNRKENSIILTGLLNQWTQDKQFIVNESKKYVVKYKIVDGKFQVIDFKEYKPGE